MRPRMVVGAGLLLVAGCAGTSDTALTAETSAATGAGANMAAYVQCLAEHGVEMPTGGPPGAGQPGAGQPSGAPSGLPADAASGMPNDRPTDMPSGMPGAGPGGRLGAPPGVDAETWQAAEDACGEMAPEAGPGALDGREPQATTGAGQYAVFWTCMSDHDVQAPASGLPADLEQADPAVSSALEICEALLPDQVTG